MSEELKSYNWFGNEQIKVWCLECRHSFPANVKWLDPDRKEPQLYKHCPFCRKWTRVKIIRT